MNKEYIRSIIKSQGITGLDSFDIQAASKGAAFFDVFMEYTNDIEFPVEVDGKFTEEYPSNDSRCITAALLAVAATLAPK